MEIGKYNFSSSKKFFSSVSVALIFPVVLWIIPATRGFLSDTFGIEFIHLVGIFSGLVTLYWTHSRYLQTQQQLKQSEIFQKLSKLNSLYSDLIKEISQNEPNIAYTRNLINSISSSLDLFFPKKQERAKYAKQVLNFSNMSLIVKNFENTDLRDANFEGGCLESINLERAKLQGAHFREANLSGALLSKAIFSQSSRADVEKYKDSIEEYDDITWVQ